MSGYSKTVGKAFRFKGKIPSDVYEKLYEVIGDTCGDYVFSDKDNVVSIESPSCDDTENMKIVEDILDIKIDLSKYKSWRGSYYNGTDHPLVFVTWDKFEEVVEAEL